MAVEMKWVTDDHRILLQTFSGKWTVDDYHIMVDEAAKLLGQADHLVHIITDWTLSTANPPNLMAGARYAEKKLPANQGVVVYVNADGVIKAFIRIAQTLRMKAVENLYLANSVEEALEIIYQKSRDMV